MWKVPLFDLNYNCEEEKAVQEVLRSKWLTMGPKTIEFESAFSSYLGEKVFSSAVSSCTAALHMSLLALDIGPGDEIIVPGLTFVAAINVVWLVGATPVLADSSSLTNWNVSAETVAEKITPRTKAVIIVHFAGYPCEMDRIKAVTDAAGLPLIEDCAHAIGSKYNGKMCGSFGDFACFSFFSNKNLSTGEGGMIVTRDSVLAEKARLLRSHGMTSLSIDRHLRKSISYDVIMPGLNYRIDEMRSTLGLVQLKKLDSMNASRANSAASYRKQLAGYSDLIIPWPEENPQFHSCNHIFPILLPMGTERASIIGDLASAGVQTSIHYPAFANFSAFKDVVRDVPETATEISSRVLTLPLYPTITSAEISLVVEALGRAITL